MPALVPWDRVHAYAESRATVPSRRALCRLGEGLWLAAAVSPSGKPGPGPRAPQSKSETQRGNARRLPRSGTRHLRRRPEPASPFPLSVDRPPGHVTHSAMGRLNAEAKVPSVRHGARILAWSLDV